MKGEPIHDMQGQFGNGEHHKMKGVFVKRKRKDFDYRRCLACDDWMFSHKTNRICKFCSTNVTGVKGAKFRYAKPCRADDLPAGWEYA